MTSAGRRPGSPPTRQAIIDAGRAEFESAGYTAASLRAVARRAGVDQALVHHYFKDKAGLFVACLDLPADPRGIQDQASQGRDPGAGVRIAERFLAQWETDPADPGRAFVTLAQAMSSSPAVARAVREFLTERVWAHRPGGDTAQAARTAALVSAQLLGAAWVRYIIRAEPFAAASTAEVAAWIGPAIDAYIGNRDTVLDRTAMRGYSESVQAGGTSQEAGTMTGVDGTNDYVRGLVGAYSGSEVSAAYLLCDRHDPGAVAFTVVDDQLNSTDITYAQLRARSERGAAALAELGVGAGDAVATLMGKSIDFVVTVLSIWRLGAVHVPLFTAFAWPAVELRLRGSHAKAIVVDPGQRGKVEDAAAAAVVVAGGSGADLRDGDRALSALLDAQRPGRAATVTGSDAPMVLLFTSGTTGEPKGVPVPVFAMASFHEYMELGLDVAESDMFWNVADPGWAYGLYYAIIGPLAVGRRSLLLASGFSPELTARVIARFGVTNLAAAPTVYRAMRAKADMLPASLPLRRASSAGEPLTPEVNEWAQQIFGITVRDHYGQTENGMPIADGWHELVRQPQRDGSMGHALPGWTVRVLAGDSADVLPSGEVGRVAIDTAASPMMWFRGYHDAPERTSQRMTGGGRWYLTGDAGRMDEDGYLYFSARDDDVILMAGYRIGPFDVESVLATHPAVAESAVVGVPDQLRGEVLEAFVVLRPGVAGGDALTTELQQRVRTGFAAHAYPRAIHYVDALPKTPSGKIQRFVLRQKRAAEVSGG